MSGYVYPSIPPRCLMPIDRRPYRSHRRSTTSFPVLQVSQRRFLCRPQVGTPVGSIHLKQNGPIQTGPQRCLVKPLIYPFTNFATRDDLREIGLDFSTGIKDSSNQSVSHAQPEPGMDDSGDFREFMSIGRSFPDEINNADQGGSTDFQSRLPQRWSGSVNEPSQGNNVRFNRTR